MRVIETTVYEINEHPNKEAVFDWVRDNWHDLGENILDDAVCSLKALADHIGYEVEYSLCIHPDRSENVSFTRWGDSDPTIQELYDAGTLSAKFLDGNCPLTGVCYDEVLLDAFRDANLTDKVSDVLQDAGERLIKALHDEGDYLYSDEGLEGMLQANEYEFTTEGELIH